MDPFSLFQRHVFADWLTPLSSLDNVSESNHLDPDIEKLVCSRCWETVFSSKSFRAMWEGSAEAIRITKQTGSSRALYASPLTYRTPPWAAILESAEASCGYCTLLRNTRRGALPSEPSVEEILVVTVFFDLDSTVQRIRITFWDESSSSSVTPKDTGIYAEPEDPAGRYITARNVVWNVDDDVSYELASKCIDDCTRHERCPRPASGFLPTRILDCSNPLQLRLVTATPSMKEYFAALSYVWGGPQLHATTTGNFHVYSEGIELEKIPKTITDAITVTRRLGLRYLWVDSFCIIQDSDEDKAHEISKMRLNFQNAFVTIAAARANSVREGFLQNTYPSHHFNPIRLPFPCPDGKMGTITVVRQAGVAEPVDSRAWCMEERVLSPRLLVFSTLGLQYECQTARINVNSSPLGLPWTVPRLPDYAFTAEPNQIAEWQLDMCWDLVLRQYTASNMTNPGDKLLAISGVAEQIHRLWPQSRYAAGIWTHQLPVALLWEQSHRKDRPETYRAPSWSWAAVDGLVSPRGIIGDEDSWRSASSTPKDDGIICKVKEVEINLKYASHPYGAVTSAHLILRAETVEATWNTREDSEPRVLIPDQNADQVLQIVGNRGLDDKVGFVGMDALEVSELPLVKVTLAAVTKTPVPMPNMKRLGQNDISGLLLLPVRANHREDGGTIYRRIGVFTANAENWFPAPEQDIHIV